MSTFAVTCDALIEDLTDNVPSLMVDSENIHRYISWFPEELLSDGQRHLAVYPDPDAFDVPSATDAPIGYHYRQQHFIILVWESSHSESSRQVSDEPGAAALLDLYEACLDRLYVDANQSMAGSFRQWFTGTQPPARSAQVRWFRIGVGRSSVLAFT